MLQDRYLVQHVLGRGGMGTVYLARDRAAGDGPVALKEMQIQATDPRARQPAIAQFQQEANLLATLDHPNLVKVSDYFEEEGRYYLVMGLVRGQTLGEILTGRFEPFPVEVVLGWATQLVDVLAYLHRQEPPVLFRDLKPDNIMVEGSGRLVLIDFGIARMLHPESATATFIQGIGSADYCPLEQYVGAEGTDPRSDIYSLGATLFHLLTLRTPPRASDQAMQNRPVPSPRNWNPQINRSLDEMLRQMLALRKEERYGSMEQVRPALQRATRLWHSGEENEPTNPNSIDRRRQRERAPQVRAQDSRRKVMIIGVLVTLALLVGALGFMNQPAGPSPTPTPRSGGKP